MAMSTGGGGAGVQWQINMTPMIDVLLVLLIIFMVIQPTLQKGLEVQVPPIEERTSQQESPDQITLQVLKGGRYAINQLPVTGPLDARIKQIFADRPRKVLFIQGGEDLAYGEVVRAIDIARGAGIEVVGLVPRD